MAELLSREKEFLKLNQKLNQMTTQTNHLMEQRQKPKRLQMNSTKTGNSTPLSAQQSLEKPVKKEISINSKRNSTKTEISAGGTITTKTAKTVPQRTRLIGHGIPEKVITSNVTSPRPKGRNILQRDKIVTTTNSPRTTSTIARKYTKVVENMERNEGKPLKKATTVSLQYFNPKFVQSPSFECLLKEEYSSMKATKLEENYDNLLPKSEQNGATINECCTSANQYGIPCYTSSPKTSISKESNKNNTNKSVSMENLVKFLKSKITILEENHEHLTQELRQHKELLEKAVVHSKNVEQQRDQAYAKQNDLLEQLNNIEMELKEFRRTVEEQSIQKFVQRKELEIVKRELRISTQANQNLEKKLNRATQDLNSARNTINDMEDAERKLKESNLINTDVKNAQIKILKKQRTDLLSAYKKQLFLIDNLKRQTACMEQAKVIDFCEKEFSKILNWTENE